VSGSRPDIGAYHRTESRSVSVRFNEATLAASALSAVAGARTATGRQYELRVRPVDAIGNYLGPDYGDRVVVSVNGTRAPGPPRDLLDGTYSFDLEVPDPVATAVIVVTVMDKPLYDGPLSGIPPPGGGGGGGAWAASLHAGVTIPVGGFRTPAGSGHLVEVDLERRLTSSFSIEGVLGHYVFSSTGAIDGCTLYGKEYLPLTSPWRMYGALGLGAFKPQGSSTKLGASLAAGVNRPVAQRLEVDAGAVYTRLFTGGVGWLGLRAGVKVTF
jgi:hypothetical protein